MFIKQLLVEPLAVFSYLVGCQKTKEAMVIDPGGDIDKIIKEAQKQNLFIKYILNTHYHWDHTLGNQDLKKQTGAQIVMHRADASLYGQEIDICLEQEDTFQLGKINFQLFHTPGHTPGGICLYAQNKLFTGDTLFVGDSGRTDLAYSDRLTLAASIRKLMQLPEETIIYPGHDYGPTPTSTIGWEKRNNVNAIEYGFYVK